MLQGIRMGSSGVNEAQPYHLRPDATAEKVLLVPFSSSADHGL